MHFECADTDFWFLVSLLLFHYCHWIMAIDSARKSQQGLLLYSYFFLTASLVWIRQLDITPLPLPFLFCHSHYHQKYRQHNHCGLNDYD